MSEIRIATADDAPACAAILQTWLDATPWMPKLHDYAETEGLVYANYYAALVGPGGALPQQYAPDGVHPNKAGYAVMRPIAERAVAEAEARAGKHK